MISQGQQFPFAELKGVSESKESSAPCKKAKALSENRGINYEFIDDPHSDIIDDTEIPELGAVEEREAVEEKGAVEGFKGAGHIGGNQGVGKVKDTVFWVQDPNVLLHSGQVNEIFPVATMTYNQKMNAISRLIILMVLVGFVFTQNMRILTVGAMCLLAIFLIQYTQNREREGFDLEDLGVDAVTQAVIGAFATDDPEKIGKREFFDKPKMNNPYNNVLVTDIVDNPNKLPAPPAFYPQTEHEILDKTKEAIQKMNPTFPDMTSKLFASLDDHFEFEQSARQFYTNPSTTIPNDQGGFAEFCYGEMISCKEGNMFACARDAPRHNLY